MKNYINPFSGQISQGYQNSAAAHNLHNAPTLHPYDAMDAYQNL